MPFLRNITVSLDYSYPAKLEISACFCARANKTDDKLETCVNEASLYYTEYNDIYLFPVFKALAKQYGLKFSVRYNKIFSLQRYCYAGLLWFSNYFVKKKGLDEYKERMKVQYDGF